MTRSVARAGHSHARARARDPRHLGGGVPTHRHGCSERPPGLLSEGEKESEGGEEITHCISTGTAYVPTVLPTVGCGGTPCSLLPSNLEEGDAKGCGPHAGPGLVHMDALNAGGSATLWDIHSGAHRTSPTYRVTAPFTHHQSRSAKVNSPTNPSTYPLSLLI